ncbi:hypothetical protein ACLMJK_003226 [Lecanora helva]
MTNRHSVSSVHALPYKPLLRPRQKPSTVPLASSKTRLKGIYITSGLAVYALTAYAVYLYRTLNAESPSSPAPDTDVSARYDSTAPHFDADVSFVERFAGINRRRKRLVSQANGDVLEVCAGTGRNALWYDVGKLKSITFLDQSGPMLEIAQKKWQTLHPEFRRVKFHTQSVMSNLPDVDVPENGFKTIVQTMGICSTSNPHLALARLGTLANPTDGKILLLEHGRSHYNWVNWILDKSAARHAEKHGCWYNRDIGEIVEKSGLRIEKVERSPWQFGTLWYIEARPPLKKLKPKSKE